MSGIEFNCPHCSRGLVVDARGAGMLVRCPRCNKPIQAPKITNAKAEKNNLPSLWNPVAAANWSLLFTGIFGAALVWKNYKALGMADGEKRSLVWIIIGIALMSLALFMPDNPAIAINAGLLIAWYVFEGRRQIKIVRNEVGGQYTKKTWGKPLGIALGCLLAYAALTLCVSNLKGQIHLWAPAKPAETRISGQVFIVTRAGQSIKLGDTPVFLYDEATIEKFGGRIRSLLEEIRKYPETVCAAAESIDAQIRNLEQTIAEADFTSKQLVVARQGFATLQSQYATAISTLNEWYKSETSKWPEDVQIKEDPLRPGIGYPRYNYVNELNKRYNRAKAETDARFTVPYRNYQQTLDKLESEFAPVLKKKEAAETETRILKEKKIRLNDPREAPDSPLEYVELLKEAGSPIGSARTDADGQFQLVVSDGRRYALVSFGERLVRDESENYMWMVWIQPRAGKGNKIQLTNSNRLSGAPGCFFTLQHLEISD